MYDPYKKKYTYNCVRCNKKLTTTNKDRTTCTKCLSWSKAGIGQTDIFGNVVTK